MSSKMAFGTWQLSTCALKIFETYLRLPLPKISEALSNCQRLVELQTQAQVPEHVASICGNALASRCAGSLCRQKQIVSSRPIR